MDCSEVPCSEVGEVIMNLPDFIRDNMDTYTGDTLGMKFREWVFTINNYTKADIEKMLKMKCRYLCWAPEVGEKGTPHIQGYVAFNAQRTRQAISKEDLPRAWLAPKSIKSTPKQCRDYIFGPYDNGKKYKPPNPEAKEFGDIPAQGTRHDLVHTKNAIMASKRKRDTMLDGDHIGTWAKYPRLCEDILTFSQEDQARERERAGIKPEVHVLWSGKSGTGKTYDAAFGKDIIRAKYVGQTAWFDGYDGHPDILFDEFEGQIDFRLFKQWIDGYAIQIPVKGGHKWLLADRIWITSNRHPSEWWDNKLNSWDREQLMRRFTTVTEKNSWTPPVMENNGYSTSSTSTLSGISSSQELATKDQHEEKTSIQEAINIPQPARHS